MPNKEKEFSLFCPAVIMLAVLFTIAGCKAPVVPEEVYQNNGKLKSASCLYYAGVSITADDTYYYDSLGRIQRIDESMSGFPVVTRAIYSYNQAGLVTSIQQPNGVNLEDVTYTYDGNNRISTRTGVTQSGTDVMTFTYDVSGLVSRIDEVQNSVPASYRLVIRDASGYIMREDIYSPTGVTPSAYVNYARNDTAKTVTVTGIGTLVLSYDSSGFYQSLLQTLAGITAASIVNTLQSGLFNSGGMNGYYYTDKDIYGLYVVKAKF